MTRDSLLLIPEYSLKFVIYSAQGLLNGYMQFKYELDNSLSGSTRIPMNSQATVQRVAEAIQAEQGDYTNYDNLNEGAAFLDDHAPDIGSSGSVMDWISRASKAPRTEA